MASARPTQNTLEARLQQYIRWAAPPGIGFAAALFGLYYFVRHPLVLVLALIVSANAAGAAFAYRQAARGHLRTAIAVQAAGMLAIALFVGEGGPSYFAFTGMLAFLSIVHAVPYVTRRALVLLTGAAIAVICAVGASLLLGIPDWRVELPDQLRTGVLVVGVASLTATAAFWLWHTRMTLADAFGELEQANAALSESERSLERKVHERTAQLEASQRALAAARDEALLANQHKSAFLANMSHELRTPLNAIIGFSEALLAQLFGEMNPKQTEYLQDIHSSGQHLLALINDILDLSKIEAGKLELNPSRVHLPTAIANALILIQERAAHRGVALVSELDPALDEITADERKLKQVLINLLANAVKFTDAGGKVTVRASRGADCVRVEVEDTGVGIAPEHHELIFEEFRQVADPSTRKQEGTGLGLALVKRMVTLHGGETWLRSALGQGSTFGFSIPRVLPAAAAGSESWRSR
ncbi:MAG TPA: ATP-binding protein [Myxococcota bacterium]|nr:ATP-binding protein [Myxococcota bacterium]